MAKALREPAVYDEWSLSQRQEVAPATSPAGLRRSCPGGSAHWQRRRRTWHGCCRPPLRHEASSFSPHSGVVLLSESPTDRHG